MAVRNNVRDDKYELMVYLVEQGLKEVDALVALTPEEAAQKFKGASSAILNTLTQYVKSTNKRIAKKGHFFPGVGDQAHSSRVASINGLRKYLAKKQPGKTLQSLGLVNANARGKNRVRIASAEDALAFLTSVNK